MGTAILNIIKHINDQQKQVWQAFTKQRIIRRMSDELQGVDYYDLMKLESTQAYNVAEIQDKHHYRV